MLTKRALLRSAGALAAVPALPLWASNMASPDLRLVPTSLQLAPDGASTAALQLRGRVPGDAVRLVAGEVADLSVRNEGSEAVAMECRGLRGVGALGTAPAAIRPGTDGLFGLAPRDPGGIGLLRAAPAAGQPCARGIRGVVVVQEAQPVPVDRDVTLMLADWLVARDGSLRFGSVPPADAVAAAVTVNGTPAPLALAAAPRSRLRLRFVNTSVQRLMLVACMGARPTVVAIDGQPCATFAPARNQMPLGPGARTDLLLDLPEMPGSLVRFTLKPTLTVAGTVEPERDLLVLRTDGSPLPARPPIMALPASPSLPSAIALEAARRIDLAFDGEPGTPSAPPRNWHVNGAPGAATGKPVLAVRRGEPVVLGLINASATLVPLHIVGHAVRWLHARDDGWEPYWRDSLLLPPRSRNHVAFVADIEGLWPITSGFDDLTLAGLSCAFSVGPP